MNKYSFNPACVKLDTEHFGENYFLICDNYTSNMVAADMGLHARPDDDFILTYTDGDEVKSIKASVHVDFDVNPSDMWEGAFSYLASIMASNHPIADDILTSIKNHTYDTYIVNTKRILDPDEEDIGDLDPVDAEDYYGMARMLTINLSEKPVEEEATKEETAE